MGCIMDGGGRLAWERYNILWLGGTIEPTGLCWSGWFVLVGVGVGVGVGVERSLITTCVVEHDVRC